ncbi:MAG: Tn3 family transposase, partial [Bifidobacterium sp.]|nr:Tn3 family transposase [Bifidobacterium sp.]
MSLTRFSVPLRLKPQIRDRSFEQQRYRASGLNLVTAAIVLWNTVYLERATSALRAH